MTDNQYSRYQLAVAHLVEAQDWLEALSDGDTEDLINQLLDTDDTAFDRIFPTWTIEVEWADITTRGQAWLRNTHWTTVWSAGDVTARQLAASYGYAWDGTDQSLAELVMKTHVVDHLDSKGAWRVWVRRNDAEPVTVWGQTPADWAARRAADPPATSLDRALDQMGAELALATASAGRLLDTLNSR